MPTKITDVTINRLQSRLTMQGLKITVMYRLERTNLRNMKPFLKNIQPLIESNFGKNLGCYLIRQAKFEVGNIFWDMKAKEKIIDSLREVKDPDSIKLLERIGKLSEVKIYYSAGTKELVFLASGANTYEAETQEILELDEDIDAKSPPFCSTAGLERDRRAGRYTPINLPDKPKGTDPDK